MSFPAITVILDQRLGLLIVDIEALGNRFCFIVFALNEWGRRRDRRFPGCVGDS